eukprot:16436126-Heterocapsa_arctica.AAC.2
MPSASVDTLTGPSQRLVVGVLLGCQPGDGSTAVSPCITGGPHDSAGAPWAGIHLDGETWLPTILDVDVAQERARDLVCECRQPLQRFGNLLELNEAGQLACTGRASDGCPELPGERSQLRQKAADPRALAAQPPHVHGPESAPVVAQEGIDRRLELNELPRRQHLQAKRGPDEHKKQHLVVALRPGASQREERVVDEALDAQHCRVDDSLSTPHGCSRNAAPHQRPRADAEQHSLVGEPTAAPLAGERAPLARARSILKASAKSNAMISTSWPGCSCCSMSWIMSMASDNQENRNSPNG